MIVSEIYIMSSMNDPTPGAIRVFFILQNSIKGVDFYLNMLIIDSVRGT